MNIAVTPEQLSQILKKNKIIFFSIFKLLCGLSKEYFEVLFRGIILAVRECIS